MLQGFDNLWIQRINNLNSNDAMQKQKDFDYLETQKT